MKKLPLDFGDTQGFHIVDCIGIPIVSQLYPVILGISPKRSTMRKSHRKSHYFDNPKYIIYDSHYIPVSTYYYYCCFYYYLLYFLLLLLLLLLWLFLLLLLLV